MELYLRYGPALLRQCERILGNRSDAEDVVQTLFEELLTRNRQSETLPYLYRACTNRCLNLMRNARRRAELLQNAMPSMEPPPQISLENRTVGISLLSKLVQRLDKKSAEILVYRYLDDMGQAEIASLTGLTRQTVSKHLDKISREAKKVIEAAEQTGGAQ